MKVVILAGGLGSRLSEETKKRPKPMIEIGGKPIIWHIMKLYSYYGFNDFIICTGYLEKSIRNYFKKLKKKNDEKLWKVNCVYTGKRTFTGSRLRKIYKLIKKDKSFFMTYGDGLSNIDLKKLLKFHKKNNLNATISCVQPPARYGSVVFKKNRIVDFKEKVDGGGYINGGYFVLNPKVLNLIKKNDKQSFENDVLPQIAKRGQLSGYIHKDFWYAIDTIREKTNIKEMIRKKDTKWMIWKK